MWPGPADRPNCSQIVSSDALVAKKYRQNSRITQSSFFLLAWQFLDTPTYHILELVVYPIKIPYDPHYIPNLHHFSEDKVLLWTDSKRHRMVVGRILGLGCW